MGFGFGKGKCRANPRTTIVAQASEPAVSPILQSAAGAGLRARAAGCGVAGGPIPSGFGKPRYSRLGSLGRAGAPDGRSENPLFRIAAPPNSLRLGRGLTLTCSVDFPKPGFKLCRSNTTDWRARPYAAPHRRAPRKPRQNLGRSNEGSEAAAAEPGRSCGSRCSPCRAGLQPGYRGS